MSNLATPGRLRQFRRLLLVFALPASVPTVLAAAGRYHWGLDLLSHFPVYYACVLAPVTLMLLSLRCWKSAAFVGAACVYNSVIIAPYLVPRQVTETESPPVHTVRGIVANVRTSNRSFAAVRRQIEQEQPDILLLMEVDQTWIDALAPATDSFPHKLIQPRADNFGIAFYSRLPIDDAEIRRLGGTGLPTIRATVRIGSQQLTAVGTHPPPPMSRRAAAARNRQLADIARLARRTTGPVLVLGDLNVTPWSPFFTDLLRDGQLHDGRRGFGILPTWEKLAGMVRIPIDHVLHSEGVAITDLRVLPGNGSDHRPIVFEARVGNLGLVGQPFQADASRVATNTHGQQ